MKKTFLMTVATAALVAGAGLASAQGMKQTAPAEKAGTMNDTKGTSDAKSSDPAIKAGQADVDRKGAVRAEDTPKGNAKPPEKAASEMKADGKTKADGRVDTKDSATKPSNGKTGADTNANAKSKADTKGDASSSEKALDTNTGQGAGAAAKMSPEQRTTIRTVIKQQNVQPLTNVTFSVSVGTKVPRTVHFYPVPVELVQFNSSWRGYEFVLVGDQIIVINPRTLEIVAILET